MTKYFNLLAIIVMAAGVSAGAKPPDKSFTKFKGQMFSACSTSSRQTLTVTVPSGMIIDTSYEQWTSGKDYPGAIAPPAGIYFEIVGGGSVSNIVVDPIVDKDENEVIKGYTLSADIGCVHSIAGPYYHAIQLSAWIKLRQRLPSDGLVARPPGAHSADPPQKPHLSRPDGGSR